MFFSLHWFPLHAASINLTPIARSLTLNWDIMQANTIFYEDHLYNKFNKMFPCMMSMRICWHGNTNLWWIKAWFLIFFFLHEKMCYTSSYNDQKLHFLVKIKWKKVYIYYYINKCFMTIVLKYKVKLSIAEYWLIVTQPTGSLCLHYKFTTKQKQCICRNIILFPQCRTKTFQRNFWWWALSMYSEFFTWTDMTNSGYFNLVHTFQ